MAAADITDGSEDPSLSTPPAYSGHCGERSRDSDINKSNVAARGRSKSFKQLERGRRMLASWSVGHVVATHASEQIGDHENMSVAIVMHHTAFILPLLKLQEKCSRAEWYSWPPPPSPSLSNKDSTFTCIGQTQAYTARLLAPPQI